MLRYIEHRLKIGTVRIGHRFAVFVVSSKVDLIKLFKIFDENSLNTSKNLNYRRSPWV